MSTGGKSKRPSASASPSTSPSTTTGRASSAAPTKNDVKNEASSPSSSVQLSQIVLENFQSIEGAVLDLAPLTVIVGKGDSGKSAILRALRAALFNDGGDEFVRDGTKQATVALAFANGDVLIWEKPLGKGSSYNLNGQSFTKLAGQVPQEIIDVTGFREIEVDSSTRISPQIHDQFDQPFIMFESGSKIARILGSLTKLNAVVQAQLICKKNGNIWSSTVGQNEAELAHLEVQRSAMPDVHYLEGVMAETGSDIELLDEAQRAIERVRALTAEREQLSLKMLDRLDCSILHQDLDEVTAIIDKVVSQRSAVKELQRVQRGLIVVVNNLEVARRALDAANETYTAACVGEGVCEACPFVA